MSGLAYAATLLGGTVGGMMVGDMLGAIPVKQSGVAATSAAATPQAAPTGTNVSVATPKQSLWLSAMFVVSAMLFLIFGSRLLRDARIS